MTLQEIKDAKRERGYTNEMLAEKSGVPLSTVQKVIGGVTANPRKATLDALAAAFLPETVTGFSGSGPEPSFPQPQYDLPIHTADCVREAPPAYSTEKREYTIEDIYALPDGVRAELIDGKLYYMATPTRTHQRVEGEMYLVAANYIRAHNGTCEVYIPPFAVFLYGDDSTYLEPDMIVVCDPSKMEERGCIGAPDWVVEIISPSSVKLDLGKKLFKYRDAGVREYWVIYPDKRIVMVYLFNRDEEKENITIYSFEDEIPCLVVEGLKIRLADHL